MLWRIVLSERITDSRFVIETEWSLDDVLDAHEALDVMEDLEIVAHRRLNPK